MTEFVSIICCLLNTDCAASPGSPASYLKAAILDTHTDWGTGKLKGNGLFDRGHFLPSFVFIHRLIETQKGEQQLNVFIFLFTATLASIYLLTVGHALKCYRVKSAFVIKIQINHVV